MGFGIIDKVVFILYGVTILSVGLWVSRKKKGHETTAEDYFLAGKALPWWAIGASLIAANISAEQFIGMSGSGFAIGLAIASYEWMSALTLIIVGKFFLPIFIEKRLYTIPEFLEKRFNTSLKSILAVFWIGLFIFVNLTSVLFLGAKAIDTIVGTADGSLIIYSIIGLALFAAAYSLWGGLSAVAWTDVIQVVLLVTGGLITTCIALDHVAPEGGIIEGFKYLYHAVPEKFSMILDKGEITTPNGEDAYGSLPGLAVLVGGLWIANLYYWGFNQYIIQRTLAAKSLKESQRGILFAGFLKLLIPLIVVIPGIAAYVINADRDTHRVTVETVKEDFRKTETVVEDGVTKEKVTIDNDRAYPWLIKEYVHTGLKGLVLAALAAAIVSSLASMLNSTATIFTMDIYKPYINKNASEKATVRTGRITVAVALVIACLIAPLLGGIDQAFQYIQEYTGLVSPGILAIFMLGLFWRKTTSRAAIAGAMLSIPVAMYYKLASIKVDNEGILDGTVFEYLFPKLPWMHQMGWTFVTVCVFMIVFSLFERRGADDPKGIPLKSAMFKTGPIFNIGAFCIMTILTVLYALFW